MKELISSLADSEPDIPEWVLTSFNDPTDPDEPGAKLVTRADNPEDLKSGLMGLDYDGISTARNDIPEQAFKGTMYYMLGNKQSVGFPKVQKSEQKYIF